ncbi:Alpha-L-arabinofuranosidase, partial [Asimina triloba]
NMAGGNDRPPMGIPPQQTLGKMTLERVLGEIWGGQRRYPAGCCSTCFCAEHWRLPRGNNNADLTLDFQQPGRSNQGPENYHPVLPNQSQNLAMNPANTSFASSIQLGNKVEIGNQSIRSGVVGGLGDQAVNSSFMQGDDGNAPSGGGIGLVGLGAGEISVTTTLLPTSSPWIGLGKAMGKYHQCRLYCILLMPILGERNAVRS